MIALPPDAVVDTDEDGDLFVTTPRVHLEADHGCFRRLGWRCTVLGAAPPTAGAARALVARGYTDGSRSPSLVELAHRARHRVVIVPATGRVLIRVDVDIPLDERVAVAVGVAEEVAAAMEPRG